MVETLSVVILALVMTKLNLKPREIRSKKQKLFDGTLAIAGVDSIWVDTYCGDNKFHLTLNCQTFLKNIAKF